MALYHSDKGSVNYDIVGSPTIVDGVVSGFSVNDYLSIPITNNNIPAVINDFEIVIKISPSSVASGLNILARSNNALFVLRRNGATIEQYFTNTDSTDKKLTYSGLVANTTIFIKTILQPSSQQLFVSQNGIEWTLAAQEMETIDVRAQFADNVTLGARPVLDQSFQGSIDLNNTYIKVNGQAWFGVCPVEVKHIKYGTSVDYTKVGSPTISNGIVSGCSNSNYLRVVYLPVDFWTKDFEICVAYTTPTTWPANTASILKGRRRRVGDTGNDNGILVLWNQNSLAMTGSYKNIEGSAPFGFEIVPQLNTKYWMKILQIGHTISGYYSTDGQNFTLAGTGDDYGYAGNPINTYTLFGNSDYMGDGSIDLNQTYIKYNGKLWFFQPATNYLIKDGKLVFADSGLYIDDNGTKTYASANIAPVPSGFTFGSTTTTDVGLVDMRTQAFTAVPGATWGKDE